MLYGHIHNPGCRYCERYMRERDAAIALVWDAIELLHNLDDPSYQGEAARIEAAVRKVDTLICDPGGESGQPATAQRRA